MSQQTIIDLWERRLAGKATDQELQLLETWMLDDKHKIELEGLLTSTYQGIPQAQPFFSNSQKEAMLQVITGHQAQAKVKQRTISTWFRYAAMLIIIVGIGTYLYLQNNVTKQAITVQDIPMPPIKPGQEKAILILADGSSIALDSTTSEILHAQGNTQILRVTDGMLAYNSNTSNTTLGYNTIQTPKGRNYQITLQDGTKVWLNAASSIKYPTRFEGNKRQVYISGEVYFEVAQNAKQPFIVEGKNGLTIEVLGTSFNVNDYTNDASSYTTLVTGSVKVNGNILQPGQQAVREKDIQVLYNVELDKVLAWRNGLFDFNGANLVTVMKQLERWYNIEVSIEKNVENIRFVGKMKKNLSLQEVLEIFDQFGLKYRLEDNKVLVIYK